MPLKVKSNNLDKYLPLADNIAPKMTNITATAGPKISASEATVMKIGPFCVISFIAKATSVIAEGDTIFTLSQPSSATFAVGVFGSGGQHGARVTGSKVEAVNSIASGEWIRGQIIYPTSW